jgi:hypothetical protein
MMKILRHAKKKVGRRLKPLILVSALEIQYTDMIVNTLASEGLRSGPVLMGGAAMARAIPAIAVTQSVELDAEFGEVPSETFMTEITHDGETAYAVAYSGAPLQGHFLHQLQAENLVRMDGLVVLHHDEEGRALECVGHLFWWRDRQGTCSAVLAHDLFTRSLPEMVAQLQAQSVDERDIANVVNRMAELLLAEAAHPHTARPTAQWLQAFATLSKKYAPLFPAHREHPSSTPNAKGL